jgi:predicted nucleic acid-binding protein
MSLRALPGIASTPGAWRVKVGSLEDHRRAVAIVEDRFSRGVLAAKLQRGGKVDFLHGEYGTSKQSIRIDCFILAVAIVHRATKIVTNNKTEFEILAEGYPIKVDTVPISSEQSVMFDVDEESEN